MATQYPPRPQPLRILVIEDNGLVGMLLAHMLNDLGHVVCGIESTEAAAVAAALHHRPDLIIVDSQLAEGSGILAMAQIIEQAGPLPHIFTSGSRIRLVKPNALLLEKPYFQKDLERAIARAFESFVPSGYAAAGSGGAAGDSAALALPGAVGSSQR